MAFENSFCRDYITEKVWSRIQGDIVPIVLGGADYGKHLPPHSYINVKDFPSPMHLAEYLHKLDNNDTLYEEYFKWKRDYSCYNGVPNKHALCDICRMIDEKHVSVIPNINTFWDKDSCISTADFYHGIMRDIKRRTISTEHGPKWPSFLWRHQYNIRLLIYYWWRRAMAFQNNMVVRWTIVMYNENYSYLYGQLVAHQPLELYLWLFLCIRVSGVMTSHRSATTPHCSVNTCMVDYEKQSGLICIMPDGAIHYKFYLLIDNGCW